MDRSKVVKEVRGWTLTILAVLAFRTFLYEAVYIPSGSMIPTLQIGDYVIVEKWAYGARLPFTETAQATWNEPERGDIVVLLAPPGNPRDDDLIKRVVAVGGDSVEIRDGHLVVNGEPVARERVPGRCSYWNKGDAGPWREEPCVDFVESLGDHRYHTHCTPYLPVRRRRGAAGAGGHRLARGRSPRSLRRQPRVRPGAGRPHQGPRLARARVVGTRGAALEPALPLRESLIERGAAPSARGALRAVCSAATAAARSSARTASIVSASSGRLSVRYRFTRANRSARPAG